MKKTNIIKRILLITIIFLCGIDICKAGSSAWRNYYDSSIKSFKCTYNVKGISGLNSIVFDVSYSGFIVTQGAYSKDLTDEIYMPIIDDQAGKLTWDPIIVNYTKDNTITYGGSDKTTSFNVFNFSADINRFYSCPTKLYLGYKNEEKNYELFRVEAKEEGLKYIEINIDDNKSEIIDNNDDDIYDRNPQEGDITDLEIKEKTRVDDSRDKKQIVQPITFEDFYNTYMYGESNFGIIKMCDTSEKQNDLSSYGLTNIKLKDATIEACLFEKETTVTKYTYDQWDEHIKGRYNENIATVECEPGYQAVRLNKVLLVSSNKKDTYYFGEVCINNYTDYTIRINSVVSNLKTIYYNIDYYKHQCDESKTQEELKKGYSLISEYEDIKEKYGKYITNAEGDDLVKKIQEEKYECLNKDYNYDLSHISPLTGALTCNGLLGGPNSEIRKMLSNILKFIRYGGPILMLLLTIVDLIKTVTSGDEKDFKKVFQNFIKRFIAAALLFFINDIIRLIFLIVGLEYECVID